MEKNDFTALIKSSISLLGDLLDLLVTEAKLAGKSAMALCGVMAFMGILCISTWLCVLGAIFLSLISIGLDHINAFLILAGFNLFLIILMICLARSYRKNLGFSATRRQLSNKPEISS